jgi:hypothetical protein
MPLRSLSLLTQAESSKVLIEMATTVRASMTFWTSYKRQPRRRQSQA